MVNVVMTVVTTSACQHRPNLVAGRGEDDHRARAFLFAAAVNDAVRKVEANSQDKMSA